LLLGRSPTSDEVDLGIRFVAAVGDAPPSQQSKLNSWERYVQVLLLSNEFVFVD
jgi:hypothetical protein